MKKTLLFGLTLLTISAQAGTYKYLAMKCKATSASVVSDLSIAIEDINDNAYMSTLASIKGDYCNIHSSMLSGEELENSTSSKKMFSKTITLNCYSADIVKNTTAVLNIDSAKNSVNLVYANGDETIESVNMNCTKEGLIKRVTDALRFPEIGS